MNSTSPSSSPSFARPQRADPIPENRTSGLRASILESALELGIASNRTVANWMFNSVLEEDEEADNGDLTSPSLTYASTATSEESNLSAGLAPRTQPGVGILVNGKDISLSLDTSVQDSPRSGLSPNRITPPDSTQRTLQFDLRATPEPPSYSPSPSPVTAPSPQPKSKFSKLRRKAKADGGGYESDAGYVSDGAKTKEKEKKNRMFGRSKKSDADAGATDHEADGGYLSEASVKKKKSKKDKKKPKNTDSPTTDYETDKGYASSFSKGRSRKQSITSPVSGGEESDGGYLSEASSKKRRFFRLNSRSRKKQDSFDSAEQAPPVPSLPPLTLPIADKWSRATTPQPSDSRNVTPLPSDTSSLIRPSEDTFTSMDTLTTSATTDTSTVDSDEKRESTLSSDDGLTRAFRDAESVRSPSIDVLSSFRRGGPLSPSKLPFRHFGHGAESPASPRSPLVPSLSPSKSVRSRPHISAPNTSNLAPKHVPVPLTLTPPTPTASSPRYPPTPDSDYVLVTPSGTVPSTPHAPEQGHASNLSVASSTTSSSNGPPSPGLPRPKGLGHFDLPPPSPPPRGPLPDVPSDISRSTSPSWSMMGVDQSTSRFPRSAPADSTDSRGMQQQLRPSPPLTDRPNTAAPHPLSREIATEAVPRIASPVPPALRGRVSPFPTAPVLPREQTTPLMRRTSKLTKDAVDRATRAMQSNMPASASAYSSGHDKWPSQEHQLGVKWQPRSASVLDTRRPSNVSDAQGSDDEQSFLAYDDDDDLSEGSPNTRPTSTEPPEPSPDVNAILAGFRAERDAQRHGLKPDTMRESHTLSAIVAGYAEGDRDTMYLDSEEGGGDRYSVWSDAASHHSILDSERSATIRAKFVKRVEAMYGKDTVPPVPYLDPGLKGSSS
ncbi:hypothetical protein BN946_scf184873.g25 [Trametes cinnabarina]|uniref:Uncharacterized protein n=1 Tax=Pycnoporus cinnabarinus TaxID=5643 RepID=A0A060SP49_PYCCI|nr:hypothetical protein BN946_scf184873.g25 [Trametes cinnabarina]